jgi:hypothetical protein
MNLKIVAIVALLIFNTTACDPSGSPVGTSSADSKPLEVELATIEYGYVGDDDIRVARFRTLLDQLSATYSSSKQQIADQTVKGQQMLREKGTSESLTNIMQSLNGLPTTATGVGKGDYSQWLAMYIVFREEGMSDDQAAKSLDGMAQAFGTGFDERPDKNWKRLRTMSDISFSENQKYQVRSGTSS